MSPGLSALSLIAWKKGHQAGAAYYSKTPLGKTKKTRVCGKCGTTNLEEH